MKKTMIVAAIASATLAVSSVASANDSWFIGGQVGQAYQGFSVSSNNAVLTRSIEKVMSKLDNPIQYGVRFGKYVNDNVRVYATISYDDISETKNIDNTSIKGELTNYLAVFSADYLFGNYAAKPFLGFSFGGQKIKGEVSSNNASESDKASGLLYGAQMGVTWQLADNWNLEGGYQYLKSNANYKAFNTKIEMDYTQNLYLSLDYIF